MKVKIADTGICGETKVKRAETSAAHRLEHIHQMAVDGLFVVKAKKPEVSAFNLFVVPIKPLSDSNDYCMVMTDLWMRLNSCFVLSIH